LHRSLYPVFVLALTLEVSVGCAAGTANSTPTAPPDQTDEPSIFEPEATPEATATTAAPTDAEATSDTGLNWPTTVTATLSTGTYVDEFADGQFTSAATASQCGPSVLFPNGFLLGFPHDIAPHDIEDATFAAPELLPGSSTSSFSISVSIAPSAANGPHPKTYLDTTDTSSGTSGNAQLSVVNGTRTLTLDASDEGGVSVHLTAVCSPI
jgi:hypothetical protein